MKLWMEVQGENQGTARLEVNRIEKRTTLMLNSEQLTGIEFGIFWGKRFARCKLQPVADLANYGFRLTRTPPKG